MSIEPEHYRQERLAARAAKYHEQVAHLRALRDEATAELCSHHVPPGNCIDCRKSTKSEPEETT